ncbi:hypothetical protein K1720_03015 [Thermococcus argininiproducens]|uniref:Uncharacterized protein n=1 Tax=Thermococcus argininiproducens TaxID=2866384 RepID=A0A9E7MAZ4_9EURY|nr:hypothetical protein [Thermococcus argininiproducens]USH00449.1 hypothetical protein K1720_03015 [Thermococcus argininiproducens]
MHKRRIIIISFLFYLIAIDYAVLYHYQNQTHFQRYPNSFAAAVEFYEKDYFPKEYLSLSSLFMEKPSVSNLPRSIASVGDLIYYFPALATMISILSTISGLSIRETILIPLGSFLLPLVLLVTIKNFIMKNEPILYTLLYIYFITYLMNHKAFKAAYMAAYTYILFFIFLLLVHKYILDDRSPSKILTLLILLLLSFPLWWHSMTMIVLFLIIGTFIVTLLLYPIHNTPPIVIKTRNLLLVSIVLTLTFSKIFSTSNYLTEFINRFSAEYLSNLYLSRINGKTPSPVIFSYTSTTLGKIYFYSHMLLHVINVILIIISIMFAIKHIHTQRLDSKSAFHISMVGGAIIAQAIFSSAYSLTALGLWYVPLVFPLVSISLVSSCTIPKKQKQAIVSALFILITLSTLLIVTAHESYELGALSLTRFNDINPSYEWILNYVPPNTQFYTDFNLFGKYLQWEGEYKILPLELRRFTPKNYELVINGKLKTNLIIDCKTMTRGLPIHSYGGRYLLKPELEVISANSNLNRVYQDGSICVFLEIPS